MPLLETTIETRDEFKAMLSDNDGFIVLKFGAEWCPPCKQIDPLVESYMRKSPQNIKCMMLDVDECFDLYAYLKSKKIAKAIPTLIAYKKGNTSIAPDFIVVGADDEQIHAFFKSVYAS